MSSLLLLSLLVFGGPGDDPLPSEYEGVVINETEIVDVVQDFGPSMIHVLPESEQEIGLCYSDQLGTSLVIGTGSHGGYRGAVGSIGIQRSQNSKNCMPSQRELSDCIDQLCLGATKQELELQLGFPLVQTNNRTYSSTVEYQREVSDWDQAKRCLPRGVKRVNIRHTVIIRFERDVASAITVERQESVDLSFRG